MGRRPMTMTRSNHGAREKTTKVTTTSKATSTKRTHGMRAPISATECATCRSPSSKGVALVGEVGDVARAIFAAITDQAFGVAGELALPLNLAASARAVIGETARGAAPG